MTAPAALDRPPRHSMQLALIAAMASNRAIGYKGQLPWRLPEDLRRFKTITMGHVLLMGRTTFDSIGRALPGRRTIVVTRQSDWSAADVEVAHSIEAALEKAGKERVFVAGGAEIYAQTLDCADRLYLTLIDREVQGDAFFPEFDRAAFEVVERETHEEATLPFEFVTLERRNGKARPT
jgi:dihydrofolate reductase